MSRDLPQERPTGKEPVARRKRKPKPKPEPRGRSPFALGDLAIAVAKAGGGDLKDIVTSAVPAAKLVGKSVAEDIEKGRGLPGAAAWIASGGRTKGPWEYKKLPKAERRSATGRVAEIASKGWVDDLDRFIPLLDIDEGIPTRRSLARDIREAGRAWQHDPVMGALTVLPLAGTIRRAQHIGETAKAVSKGEKLPGKPAAELRKQPLAGKPKSKYTPPRRPVEDAAAVARSFFEPIPARTPRAIAKLKGRRTAPPSASGTGQTIQAGARALGEVIERVAPNSRYSPAMRDWREAERIAHSEVRREGAGLRQAEIDLARVARKGPVRRRLRKPVEVEQEALLAALEAPPEMSIAQAVGLKLDAMEMEPATPALIRHQDLLQQAAKHGDLDSERMRAALDAMRWLSAHADESAREIKRRTVHPDDLPQVLAQMDKRKSLVIQHYIDQGLLDPKYADSEAFYFPHRDLFDRPREVSPAGTRLPATGGTVGRPTRTGVNMQKNELFRFREGTVLSDPAVLVETLRTRLRFLDTLAARDELWEAGTPIKKGEPWPKGRVVFVRNPATTPERLKPEIKAAQTMGRQEGAETSYRAGAEIDTEKELLAATGDLFWSSAVENKIPEPAWLSDVDNVRYVSQAVARTRIGNVFQSAPHSALMAVLGTGNALMRLGRIYLPNFGAKYVVRNGVQNVVLMSLTKPTAWRNLLRSQRSLKYGDEGDRAVYHMILSEAGSPLARALPERTLATQTNPQRLEKWIGERNRRLADKLSSLADDSFRTSVWLTYARQFGVDINDTGELLRFLTGKESADLRRTISQRTRDDMIDFDALSPLERETMTRVAFLYPLIKGSLKWPWMYAREHPLKAGAVARVGEEGREQGLDESIFPGSLRERSMVGKLGSQAGLDWADPGNISGELIQAIPALARGDLGYIEERLQPATREAIDALSPRPIPWKERREALGRTFVPGWQDVPRARPLVEDPRSTLTGALGNIVGKNVETPRPVKKFWAKENSEMRQRAEALFARTGYSPPPVVYDSHRAYLRRHELESRAKFAASDIGRDLTWRDKAQIASQLVREYPQLRPAQGDYEPLTPAEINGWDDEQLEAYVEFVRDAQGDARSDFIRITTPLLG